MEQNAGVAPVTSSSQLEELSMSKPSHHTPTDKRQSRGRQAGEPVRGGIDVYGLGAASTTYSRSSANVPWRPQEPRVREADRYRHDVPSPRPDTFRYYESPTRTSSGPRNPVYHHEMQDRARLHIHSGYGHGYPSTPPLTTHDYGYPQVQQIHSSAFGGMVGESAMPHTIAAADSRFEFRDPDVLYANPRGLPQERIRPVERQRYYSHASRSAG